MTDTPSPERAPTEPRKEAPAWDALELALQIIHATGGDPARAKEAAAEIDRFRAAGVREERERIARAVEDMPPGRQCAGAEDYDDWSLNDVADFIRREPPHD